MAEFCDRNISTSNLKYYEGSKKLKSDCSPLAQDKIFLRIQNDFVRRLCFDNDICVSFPDQCVILCRKKKKYMLKLYNLENDFTEWKYLVAGRSKKKAFCDFPIPYLSTPIQSYMKLKSIYGRDLSNVQSYPLKIASFGELRQRLPDRRREVSKNGSQSELKDLHVQILILGDEDPDAMLNYFYFLTESREFVRACEVQKLSRNSLYLPIKSLKSQYEAFVFVVANCMLCSNFHCLMDLKSSFSANRRIAVAISKKDRRYKQIKQFVKYIYCTKPVLIYEEYLPEKLQISRFMPWKMRTSVNLRGSQLALTLENSESMPNKFIIPYQFAYNIKSATKHFIPINFYSSREKVKENTFELSAWSDNEIDIDSRGDFLESLVGESRNLSGSGRLKVHTEIAIPDCFLILNSKADCKRKDLTQIWSDGNHFEDYDDYIEYIQNANRSESFKTSVKQKDKGKTSAIERLKKLFKKGKCYFIWKFKNIEKDRIVVLDQCINSRDFVDQRLKPFVILFDILDFQNTAFASREKLTIKFGRELVGKEVSAIRIPLIDSKFKSKLVVRKLFVGEFVSPVQHVGSQKITIGNFKTKLSFSEKYLNGTNIIVPGCFNGYKFETITGEVVRMRNSKNTETIFAICAYGFANSNGARILEENIKDTGVTKKSTIKFKLHPQWEITEIRVNMPEDQQQLIAVEQDSHDSSIHYCDIQAETEAVWVKFGCKSGEMQGREHSINLVHADHYVNEHKFNAFRPEIINSKKYPVNKMGILLTGFNRLKPDKNLLIAQMRIQKTTHRILLEERETKMFNVLGIVLFLAIVYRIMIYFVYK
ncbi:MAG: hypothetical protein MHMPM18_000737 [Marteilia pararefringens]